LSESVRAEFSVT